jgi:uncharacterized membrane protein YdbT with pleckstrin-like domain
MENTEPTQWPVIETKPAVLFAFFKICPFLLAALGFLWMAWHYWPGMLWLSVAASVIALYRYIYIRRIRYTITGEYLQVTRGVLFRRLDTVELFRVKDYILTQSVLLQILRLMDLRLITTDPVNPQVWLRGIPLSGLIEQLRERVLTARI